MTGAGDSNFCVPELPAGGRLMRTVSRLTPLPGPVAPCGRGGRVILTVSFLGSSLILEFWGNKYVTNHPDWFRWYRTQRKSCQSPSAFCWRIILAARHAVTGVRIVLYRDFQFPQTGSLCDFL